LAIRSKPGSRGDSIARNRWLVHLALILGFLAAVISAIFLSRKYFGHSGTTDHSIIGLLFLGLVIVHLTQRRRTVRRLLSQLFDGRNATEHRSHLAESDTTLWILTMNAMVSGVADFVVGHTVFLPIPGPNILQKWHAMSVLVLLVYVIVHVVRRRKRLRTSHIR
jgi:heme exporter protein D